jgi:hypothetical protein
MTALVASRLGKLPLRVLWLDPGWPSNDSGIRHSTPGLTAILDFVVDIKGTEKSALVSELPIQDLVP